MSQRIGSFLFSFHNNTSLLHLLHIPKALLHDAALSCNKNLKNPASRFVQLLSLLSIHGFLQGEAGEVRGVEPGADAGGELEPAAAAPSVVVV